MSKQFFKDDVLLNIYTKGFNIAQFVSTDNKGALRNQVVSGIFRPCKNTRDAVKSLLVASDSGLVNVRSYSPGSHQGCPFVYGLSSLDDVESVISKRVSEGLYTVINETIDVKDGGVSGVSEGGVVEVAPGTTPRGVEGLDVSPFPSWLARKMIENIYSIDLDITHDTNYRVEFSVHPSPCGVRKTNAIVWEEQETNRIIPSSVNWPNPLSRHIGDKAFGLMVASLFGFRVPKARVFLRDTRIRSFSFGVNTNSTNKWTRTCPSVQMPGKFQTVNKLVDPYILMQEDDSSGEFIPGCIVQDEVKAKYSGATITGANGEPLTSGVVGFGDCYMAGGGADNLPDSIVFDVHSVWQNIVSVLGASRFEWVHDGDEVWVVQLHCGKSVSRENVIVPGKPERWVEFSSSMGLEYLRDLVKTSGIGIKITSPIGMTSHVADILRKNNIPSYLTE